MQVGMLIRMQESIMVFLGIVLQRNITTAGSRHHPQQTGIHITESGAETSQTTNTFIRTPYEQQQAVPNNQQVCWPRAVAFPGFIEEEECCGG